MKKLSLLFVLLVSSSLVFGQANGLVISNKASGGAIGTAAATVDVASLFNVNQTTASQTLTVPNLTNATNGKTIHINNVGSTAFTLLSKTIEPGTGILLRWTGSAWNISGVGNASGGGGGSGDIDGVTAGVGLTGGGTTGTVTLNADTTNVLATLNDLTASNSNTQAALDLKAPLASPALTGNPTVPAQLAADSSTRVANTAFVKRAVSGISGGGGGAVAANNQRLGTVFIDYFSSSSNYTQTQTSGTQTFNAGYVTMTGGTNSLNNKMMYNYNGTGTLLDDHIVTLKGIVTANATTYGPGVGMQVNPIEDHSYSVFLNTSAGGSRGQIVLINPLSNAVIATSSTSITFTNTTDTIELSFRYAVNKVIATARNITTPTQTVSSVVIPNVVTLEFEWSPTSTTTPARIARPTVYCYGGTHNVYSLKMESDLIQNPFFTLIGDSRAFGLGCTSFKSCYANLTGIRGGYKTMVWARGGATATSLLANISELGTFFKGGHKGYVMIAVGVNDAFAGRTLAQFQSDYIALIQAIQAFGGTPIVTKIANLTSTYSGQGPVNTLVNSYNAWLITLPFKQVDENTPLNLSGYLNVNNSSDGVHLSDVGMAVEANSLNSQLATLNVLYPTATYTGSGGTFTVPQAVRIIGGASVQGTVTQGTLLSGETTGQNATVTFGTADVTRQTYSQWCQNPTNYAQVAHYNSSFAGNHTGTSIANAASSEFSNTAGGTVGGKLVTNASGSFLLSGATSTNAGIGITTAGIRIGAISTIHNAATAWLHLPAGTATAGTAPIKLTSGTNLTTAETGAFEYNGTNLFFTRTGTTRENVMTTGSVNTVSPTSPNRTITVVIDGVTYYIAAKTTND